MRVSVALSHLLAARYSQDKFRGRVVRSDISSLVEVWSRDMDLTALLVWLIIGAIAGWLAGEMMRGRGFGLLGNLVIGILGALVGGWLFGLLGISTGTGFPIGSLVTAFLGAIILLALSGLVRPNTA